MSLQARELNLLCNFKSVKNFEVKKKKLKHSACLGQEESIDWPIFLSVKHYPKIALHSDFLRFLLSSPYIMHDSRKWVNHVAMEEHHSYYNYR